MSLSKADKSKKESMSSHQSRETQHVTRKRKKHLTAFKLKQSLLNLEACHFFLGLTQFKLAPGEIVPRAGLTISIFKACSLVNREK